MLGIKKETSRSRLNDVLSKRMALRTHSLSSGRVKKRRYWSLLSDVSRGRKAMRNHFLHPANWKYRLLRIPLNDVLRRRMALNARNLPSGRMKKRHYWSLLSVVSGGVERPWEIIFLILRIEKKRLERIRLINILSRRMALRTHILPSVRLKKRPVKLMKRCFKVLKGHAKTFRGSRAWKKATCTKSVVMF
jgi:hypothetical protein